MKTVKNLLALFGRRKILVIILCGFYLAGIILGVVLPKYNEKEFFTHNVISIFSQSIMSGGKVSVLVSNRLFADTFCLFVIYIASMLVFLLPINVFLIFYKGYIQGAVMAGLISCFGMTGFLLYIFVVFSQSLISSFAMILMTVCGFDFHKRKCKNDVKSFDYLTSEAIICFLLIVVSLVIQVLMLIIFLKPINYSF